MAIFGEIRYESSARIVDRLRIQLFYNNWYEKGLTFFPPLSKV
jgi:hypothetical protein